MTRLLPAVAIAIAIPLLAQNPVIDLTAAPGTAQVAPGQSVNAWLYNGTLPGPTLRITEGQTLRVRFHNDLPEPSTVHWHGQPVRLGMDGVPGISRPAVAPGQEFLYELDGLHPGTYFYHPHVHGTQIDAGLHGVLIVDPANSANDPQFDIEQTIVLDDWRNPLGGTFTGHLINGSSSQGQTAIVVQPGQQLRLRVVNASAIQSYVFALDGHPMTVTHADGNRVQPVTVQAVPIGMGERYDVIVDCNNPGTWSLAASAIDNRTQTLVRAVVQYAGQTQPHPSPTFVPANLSTGTLLSYAQLAAYFPVTPITATPDRSYNAVLSHIGGGPGVGMLWTINGQTWPNVTPFVVAAGDEVQLSMTNSGMTMMQMFHPMHIHGHYFRLMGTAGGTTAPPVKDTVLIRPSGQPFSSAQVQIEMDNPGRWLFHCHDVEHMARGMMTMFDYTGDVDGDQLPDNGDMEPTMATPVVTVADSAAAFAPGGSGAVAVQWTPGEGVFLFVGWQELATPLPVPPYGVHVLDPASAVLFGNAVVQAQGQATFAYAVPNDPILVGFRIGLQAIGSTALAGGIRLSTYQAMTVR
ncbi:MAG: multicopper oxidase family protein [Planctomycetes bacterium]|nr:multicopper oxidase family protein [Planctomycetota bacterium]